MSAFRLLGFYSAVSPSSEVRDALEQAKELFAAFDIETAMIEELFAIINAVLQNDAEDLDLEAKRWLEKGKREHDEWVIVASRNKE